MNFRPNLSLISFFFFSITYTFSPFLYLQASDSIKQAEQLLAEGHFQDAIPIYHQMLVTDAYPCSELILRLAHCHLEISQSEKVLNLLAHSSLSPKYEFDHHYLLSTIYRKDKEYQKALHLLNELSLTKKDPLLANIAFEKGINLFHLNRLEEAELCFKSILWEPAHPNLYYFAKFYLIRIALLKDNQERAANLLNQLAFPLNHPLSCERAYLAGVIDFLNHDFSLAIVNFEKALKPHQAGFDDWTPFIKRCLISSYLHETLMHADDLDTLSAILQKAEYLLNELYPTKDVMYDCLLGDFYLLKAHLLKDQEALDSAKKHFSNQSLFESHQSRLWAALKFASTLPDNQERSDYYQSLKQTYGSDSNDLSEILYWEGVDYLNKCLSLYKMSLNSQQSHPLFKKARHLFKKASAPNYKASRALKAFALAALLDKSQQHLESSACFLKNALENLPDKGSKKAELHFLTALVWKRFTTEKDPANSCAIQQFNQVIDLYPESAYVSLAHKALALLHMQRREWDQAITVLNKMDLLSRDMQFLLAICHGKLGQPELKQNLLLEIFKANPHCKEAPIAYFYTYTYQEYMKGQKKAIKHLQSMPTLFPQHPLSIQAHYLVGLDYLKDHTSQDGTLLRKKDLIAAIDAFHQAEITFDLLHEKKLLAPAIFFYFTQIRYHSMLERALANLAVAESSQGAKSQIYFSYAEEVFSHLIQHFEATKFSGMATLVYNKLLQESHYWLAILLMKKNQWEEADQLLNRALQFFEEEEGYLLSRIWYEKGKIAQNSHDFALAIASFQKSEKAGLGKSFLSPDQKLDLWIEESLCFKECGDLDNAMLLLSKAVNDEAISSLRVKAMFLRAELYALQGRQELALKQLDAVAKKGGPWGKLAKNKLEKEYGY